MENMTYATSERELSGIQSRFISKVYGLMAFALLITGLVSMTVAGSEQLLYAIVGNQILFFGLIIGEFFLVARLSAAINKLSVQTAGIMFVVYAILNGLTLSVIFLAYTASSIASTFYITAGTFAIMSAYGYYTKRDLTKIGQIAFMALVGIIIASIVNFFLASPMIYWITSILGVLIFVGLIAYDTQKIKTYALQAEEGSEGNQKLAILGALALYLDFINLFLFLLRLFGRRD